MNPIFNSHENKTIQTQRQQQQQQQQQQDTDEQQHDQLELRKTAGAESTETAAVALPSTSITSTTPYKHSKLDGVLYHFYSKTLAVITNGRLTHYDAASYDTTPSNPSTPLTESSGPINTKKANAIASSASSSSGRRANKWFELDVADYDIFREELRLWRNISTMIPPSVLESSTDAVPENGYVPAMVLDIILDTSSLTIKHLLSMDQSSGGPAQQKRRVRVDVSNRRISSGSGRKQKEDQHVEGKSMKQIVLESWRLEIGACNPSDPPDLPTLYRSMTAHLKELYSLAKLLPVYPLFMRIQRGKSSGRKTGVETSSEVDLLKMGVRLRVDRSDEEESIDDDNICGLREPLASLGSSSDEHNAKVTEIYTFEPIKTAIGILQCTIEYRIDADFFVEDIDKIPSIRDLELDEDYFRPSQPSGQSRSQAKAITSLQENYLSASPSSNDSGNQEDSSNIIATPHSNTFDRRQGILASEGMTSSSASGQGATPSPPSEGMNARSSATASTTTSVFSTNTSSGRPVAGLSNLRRSPSMSGHGSSPTTTMTALTGGAASSPNTTTTTILASDAAFLTYGRRTSTSERRLRSVSSLSTSTDKSSPPSASGVAAPPSPNYHPSSRPILARTSASALPSLRSGSYSPSSPSPLAQQMSAQRSNVASQSSYRLSSSPSYRTASLPMSASPNLRSVFQMYHSSQSQASISSLSRTPPKYITEGSSSTTQQNSSLGLHSSSNNQSSPSQSSIAEGGRQQPSVAPQMIKRYSSTFNYRQGRQASTGGSMESESSSGALYSKSWQARIEQRQAFTARSLGREDGSHLSTGSGPGGGAFFSSSYSPQTQRQALPSTSQEDDLDEFVRMIDSNQPDGTSSSSTNQVVESNFAEIAHRKNTLSSYTNAASGIGFTRQGLWNRNQVDEMLNKMQSNVREFSTSSTSRGSGTSGGAATTPSSGGGSGLSGPGLDSPGGGVQSVSPNFVRSPLSKVGFSAAPTAVASPAAKSSGVTVPTSSASSSSSNADGNSARRSFGIDRRNPQYRYNMSAVDNARPDANLTSSDVREEAEDGDDEDGNRTCTRSMSRGSVDLYANQPHMYDPLEDEAVGRLELLQDDGTQQQQQQHNHPTHRHNDAVNSEAAERRRADLEMARTFGQVVSSSSSRGTPRASLSPWRNRINSNRNGHGTSSGNGANN